MLSVSMLSVIMLIVIMLSVTMQSVTMLSVIILSYVAPFKSLPLNTAVNWVKFKEYKILSSKSFQPSFFQWQIF